MPRQIVTGIKVLYRPAEQEPELDVVAIHGIGAHPDDTWCKNVDTKESRYVNWLTEPDMLPSIVPNARIMRYGYESEWFGENAISATTSTIANRFLLALKRQRAKFPFRPLIFIAHCFGGLVILNALNDANEDKAEWPGIFDSTTGLVFFGTPFRGAGGIKVSEMLELARSKHGDDQVQESVLRVLAPGDEYLQTQLDRFLRMRASPNMSSVACFWEMKPCDISKILHDSKVERQICLVVSRDSGSLDLSESTKRYSLSRTHFDMNKFGAPDEEDFETVKDVLKAMAEDSPKLMSARAQSK